MIGGGRGGDSRSRRLLHAILTGRDEVRYVHSAPLDERTLYLVSSELLEHSDGSGWLVVGSRLLWWKAAVDLHLQTEVSIDLARTGGEGREEMGSSGIWLDFGRERACEGHSQNDGVSEVDVHCAPVYLHQGRGVHHLVTDTKQAEGPKVGVGVHLSLSALKLLPL